MRTPLMILAAVFSLMSCLEASPKTSEHLASDAYRRDINRIVAWTRSGQISAETAERLRQAAYDRYLAALEAARAERLEELERQIEIQEYRESVRRAGRYTRR